MTGIRFKQRKTIRLRGYDYSSPGAYMVTICACNRLKVFSSLNRGAVILSETGRIVERCWLDIPKHFPGVKLDVWVVMPNHLHGILAFVSERPGGIYPAPTARPGAGGLPELGNVVGVFKAAVSREARRKGITRGPLWQRGYYEHVIRNQTDLDSAREYIALNPLRLDLPEYPFAWPE